MKKAGLLSAPNLGKCDCKEAEIFTMTSIDQEVMVKPITTDDDVLDFYKDEGMMKVEKEMWDQFCQTGFWRNPSQRLVF